MLKTGERRAYDLIDEDEVKQYLTAITASGAFGRSERRLKLLDYLLRAELADEGARIKAYSIGVDVLGKPADFDPASDSSVRVEVGRLRTAIALFEAGNVGDTKIKVDIPVGNYRPVISRRDKTGPVEPTPPDNQTDPQTDKTPKSMAFPKVLALGCIAAIVVVMLGAVYTAWHNSHQKNIQQPVSLTIAEFTGEDLGKELSALVRNSFLNNQLITLTTVGSDRLTNIHFVVTGHVVSLEAEHLVTVELTNTENGQIVWNNVLRIDADKNVRDEVDRKINGELETRLLGAVKVLLEDRPFARLTPQELFILGTWVSGPAKSTLAWEAERVTLMKRALAMDPDFGPAHSVLADKYGFLANVHPDWDTEENLQLSRFHAERALELLPLDANVMFNVAQSYWHAGRVEDSEQAFRRVIELDSSNSLARFFSIVMPYWCTDVPDDVMQQALAFDQGLSRDDPIRWIVLTWVATLHANRGEYTAALQATTSATQIFQNAYTYMLHAVLLNKAGEPTLARQVIERQIPHWPGSSADHYVGSTLPRLCDEKASLHPLTEDFRALVTIVKDISPD